MGLSIDIKCDNCGKIVHDILCPTCADQLKSSHDEDTITALRARVAELEAAQRWIPVTERLPEDTRDVLVWCGITEKGCYSPSQHMWSVYDDGYSPIPVTHWMPLPQPPEVK
mgnify:CR=1 FL=1